MEFDSNGNLKLPANLERERDILKRKEAQKAFLENFDLKNKFNLIDFLKNKKYLGKIEAKRNIYHGFYYNEVYMLSTGIKSKTNINFILEKELKELEEKVHNFNCKGFTIYDLIDFCKDKSFTSERLEYYRNDFVKYSKYDDTEARRYLYGVLLEICYLLSIEGKLNIDTASGRKILFSEGNLESDLSYPIFSNISKVDEMDDFILLKDNNFYHTLKYKNFRGNFFPYLVEEIKYLHKLVLESNDNLMDIDYLVNKMNYQKRFIEIYNMIIEQNLRNEREEHTYFQSRIKSALKIIKFLYNDIEINKVGRSYEFRRKN